MLKQAWCIALVVALAILAATVHAQQDQQVSPLASALATASDSEILYDGAAMVELAATSEGESDAEAEDDAALIEMDAEGDSEAEADAVAQAVAEAEAEAEAEAAAEAQERSLIEKAKKGGKKAKKAAAKGKKAKAKKAKKSKGKKASKKARKPRASKPKVEASLPAPAADANAIVQTGRGRRGRGCRGSRCARRKHGWGIAPEARRRVQQRLPAPRLTGAASTLTRANVRCVLCQFITQKLKNSLTGSDDAASTSLIEAFAFANAGAQSRIESTVQAAAYADAASQALPSLFDHGADAPRRFRHTDILAHRAARARFTQVRTGAKQEEETKAQREAYLKLYSTVYASFEDLCAKKMPIAYLPYCNDMLKSYRFFAQGINYADRPEQICMNGNYCDHRSYVRRVTHNTYQREPGDA